VRVEAFERAFGRLGIKGTRWHMMRCEVVEHGARDRRLADAALVRTHYDHCWLRHGRPLADAAPSHTRPVGSAISAENSGKIEGVSRPLSPDSVLHIRRAVWKPDVARAFRCAPQTDYGAIAAGGGGAGAL